MVQRYVIRVPTDTVPVKCQYHINGRYGWIPP